MPIHTAHNHPHCFIDCPNGGFAYYIESSYSCKTGCNNDDLGVLIADTLKIHGWNVRTSASVGDITGHQLKELVRRIRSIVPTNPPADVILDDLQAIGGELGGLSISASWSNLEGVDALRSLRDAAAGLATTP